MSLDQAQRSTAEGFFDNQITRLMDSKKLAAYLPEIGLTIVIPPFSPHLF